MKNEKIESSNKKLKIMRIALITKKLTLASVAVIGAAVAAHGQDVYVSDNPTPWGYSGINNAMTAVLPSTTFETFGAAGTSVFNPANQVILIEGGDGNSTDFDSYFQTPGVIAAAQSWVAAGGDLIINGGRWTYDNLNIGFGLTMKLDPDYALASYTGTVVDSRLSAEPNPTALWEGLFSLAAGGSKAGGAGFNTMITTSAGNTSLGEENYGLGVVFAGGMTSPEFQSGSGTSYTGNYFSHDIITTAPDAGSTSLMLGLGFAALGVLRRKLA